MLDLKNTSVGLAGQKAWHICVGEAMPRISGKYFPSQLRTQKPGPELATTGRSAGGDCGGVVDRPDACLGVRHASSRPDRGAGRSLAPVDAAGPLGKNGVYQSITLYSYSHIGASYGRFLRPVVFPRPNQPLGVGALAAARCRVRGVPDARQPEGPAAAGRPGQPLAHRGRALDPAARRGADRRHLFLHHDRPALDRQGMGLAGADGAGL